MTFNMPTFFVVGDENDYGSWWSILDKNTNATRVTLNNEGEFTMQN